MAAQFLAKSPSSIQPQTPSLAISEQSRDDTGWGSHVFEVAKSEPAWKTAFGLRVRYCPNLSCHSNGFLFSSPITLTAWWFGWNIFDFSEGRKWNAVTWSRRYPFVIRAWKSGIIVQNFHMHVFKPVVLQFSCMFHQQVTESFNFDRSAKLKEPFLTARTIHQS